MSEICCAFCAHMKVDVKSRSHFQRQDLNTSRHGDLSAGESQAQTGVFRKFLWQRWCSVVPEIHRALITSVVPIQRVRRYVKVEALVTMLAKHESLSGRYTTKN